MTDPNKFAPFEKTDIRPYVEQMGREVKALAEGYDIEKVKTGLGEGFFISIDVQQYIDDAVKNLHKQVASQVESNLQALLREAFEGALSANFPLSPIAMKALWVDFLGRLALAANVKIEDRT